MSDLRRRLDRLEQATREDLRVYTLEQMVAGSYGLPVGAPAGQREPGRPSLEELILAAAGPKP